MTKKRLKKIIIILIIIGVAVALYFVFSKKKKVEYVTAAVLRGDLLQTVSETGSIKAASEINLGFTNSGKIAKIPVKIGENIKKDQVLAELDYNALLIEEAEVKARLEVAQANLNKLLSGAAHEQIAVSQANVRKAETSYISALAEFEKIKNTVAEEISQAEKNLNDLQSNLKNDLTTYEKAVEVARTSLNNTINIYSQAINNKEDSLLITLESEQADANTALDNINTIITDSDTETVLSIKNTNYLTNTINARSEAKILLSNAKIKLSSANISPTEDNMNKAVADTLTALNKTLDSLKYCFDVLEYSITSPQFTQTELDTYKTTISANLTTISASITNVQTADQNLKTARLNYDTYVSNAEESLSQAEVSLDNAILTAKNSLNAAKVNGEQKITAAQSNVNSLLKAWEVTKTQLTETKAPARNEDVALSQAQIRQAEAALEAVKNKIENSIIKSPIDGIITEINYDEGEQTGINSTVISLLGMNNYEIEVDISEADIAKLNIGNTVEITLDSLGDEIKLAGKVYFIEPAETIIQDVIYYKAKIEFINDENYQKYSSGIKSGMTANLVIAANEKKNILIIPSRAIIQKNGSGKFVRLLVNGELSEVKVATGLKGDEGMIEVLSGLKEGDQVITLIKE